MEWRLAGWSVCLPLLIYLCTIKSRSSLLAPAHAGGPGKRAVKRLWWWWCDSIAGFMEAGEKGWEGQKIEGKREDREREKQRREGR